MINYQINMRKIPVWDEAKKGAPGKELRDFCFICKKPETLFEQLFIRLHDPVLYIDDDQPFFILQLDPVDCALVRALHLVDIRDMEPGISLCDGRRRFRRQQGAIVVRRHGMQPLAGGAIENFESDTFVREPEENSVIAKPGGEGAGGNSRVRVGQETGLRIGGRHQGDSREDDEYFFHGVYYLPKATPRDAPAIAGSSDRSLFGRKRSLRMRIQDRPG